MALRSGPIRHRHRGAAEGPRSRRSRGVALVEFAIVLPLLSVMVFGVIDLGRALTAWNEAKGAAGAAGDYVATSPYRRTNSGACSDPGNATFRGRAEGGNDYDFTFETRDSSGNVIPHQPWHDCTTTLSFAERDLLVGRTITVTAERDFELLTPLMEGLVGPVTVRSHVTVKVSR